MQMRLWPPTNWLLVSCDVGQGDATVINLGNHQAVVVDVGPDPALLDKCLSRLHIRSIPLLILTHFHADHVGGIDAAFHHRRVGIVRVTALGEPQMTTNFVTNFLAHKHATLQVITAGDHLVLGNVEIQCLWPAELIRGQGSDANNASIVLLVTIKGYKFLLSGDVEAPAQQAITKRFKLPDVDVLKVAHHGSRNQDSLFAQELNPDIALISVGKANGYGHPAAETLALYELLGAKIYRTDLSGSISIVESGGRLQAMTSR
jgi:competence protein ComEC